MKGAVGGPRIPGVRSRGGKKDSAVTGEEGADARGLCLRQTGDTCQRRRHTEGGLSRCLGSIPQGGSRPARVEVTTPSPSSLGIKVQRRADRQATRCLPPGNMFQNCKCDRFQKQKPRQNSVL